MVRKELVALLEKNIILFGKLSERINRGQIHFDEYSRQQVQFLVRLYLSGKSKLKDIAAREFVPAPNLCTAFRKLERDGLVSRVVDESDRRNTWYSVTENGARVACQFIDMFHNAVSAVFKNISKSDEDELIKAFKAINNVFVKMESENA
ncbi:MAG: MarR family winged helix-turn-helix transcriptional regulator [Alphaproteobacteria bacterium]|nr:MarR family winged helix-turn-helix transcriptional regulator [Alphaproteobacteria bacterium]